MMGLRLTEGIERARFRAIVGRDPLGCVDAGAVRRLVEGGFLRVDDTHMRATPAGRQRLNAVLAMLLPG